MFVKQHFFESIWINSYFSIVHLETKCWFGAFYIQKIREVSGVKI